MKNYFQRLQATPTDQLEILVKQQKSDIGLKQRDLQSMEQILEERKARAERYGVDPADCVTIHEKST